MKQKERLEDKDKCYWSQM